MWFALVQQLVGAATFLNPSNNGPVSEIRQSVATLGIVSAAPLDYHSVDDSRSCNGTCTKEAENDASGLFSHRSINWHFYGNGVGHDPQLFGEQVDHLGDHTRHLDLVLRAVLCRVQMNERQRTLLRQALIRPHSPLGEIQLHQQQCVRVRVREDRHP